MSAAVGACGPKKPSASALEAARLAREAAELKTLAESRTLQGCYDCLLEAKAAYAKLATGAERPAMLVRLFETELLIALREKELAIDAASAIARARALVPELPPALQAERYIKVVEAVPADSTGSARGRRHCVPSIEGPVRRRPRRRNHLADGGACTRRAGSPGDHRASGCSDDPKCSRVRCVSTWRSRSTARTSGGAGRRRSCRSPGLPRPRRSRGRSSWIRFRRMRRRSCSIASASAMSCGARRSKPYAKRSRATPRRRIFSRGSTSRAPAKPAHRPRGRSSPKPTDGFRSHPR